MADLLRRWLEVSGYAVTQVKNITDVGHLVADSAADAGGEDKVEKQAREEKVDPLAIAKKYAEQYLEDEKALNMVEPEERPYATETIKEMIAIIEELKKAEHAYETDDGLYFSIQSFPDYGKLSGNTLEKLGKLEEGVRVDMKESKKHPADFALWKKCVGENAHHVLRWSYPDGDRVEGDSEDPNAGFPGWHIECSAMSMKFLGKEIDIHTGGEDNIFPHHECEIAQSEGANKNQFVHYWLHKRRVNFADEKMSKSLGNVLFLPDILEKGFSALDLRYFFLSSHYRSHTSFTWKGLEDAKKARLKISEWIEEVGGSGAAVSGAKRKRSGGPPAQTHESTDGEIGEFHKKRFDVAMNDDLNTPQALAEVFALMAWSRKQSSFDGLQDFVTTLEETFGCFQSESVSIPSEVQSVVDEREAARKAGDYDKADQLRKKVLSMGFVLEDSEGGVKVVPADRRG
jgi:cysteinyl-tRNA synthetase